MTSGIQKLFGSTTLCSPFANAIQSLRLRAPRTFVVLKIFRGSILLNDHLGKCTFDYVIISDYGFEWEWIFQSLIRLWFGFPKQWLGLYRQSGFNSILIEHLNRESLLLYRFKHTSEAKFENLHKAVHTAFSDRTRRIRMAAMECLEAFEMLLEDVQRRKKLS
ncbi:hypothetical protein VNO77_07485 [Canavalia gladiata]|uniref:Uncharacterized protein n=1 Tax=Canavalia gladiata TaxID=3824 RepID=A0AAN9M8H7_CANGL